MDVNSNTGITALSVASHGGNVEMMDILLKLGAGVNSLLFI